MIEALEAAAERVAATIKDHREKGDGLIAVCDSLGIDFTKLGAFVDGEVEKLNGSGTTDGAMMHGALIAAVATQEVADAASGSAAPLPTDGDLDWATIGMLIPPHPLRTRMLRYLNQHGTASPNQLSQALGEPLGNVSYHMKALAGDNTEKPIKDRPLVQLVDTQPRRGAVEHFYSLTDTARGKEKPHAA